MSRPNDKEKHGDRGREGQRGERFVEAMAGRTYAMVAEAVGAAASTIHNYANGKIPSADVGIKIAKFLEIDLDWWINGEGEPTQLSGLVYVPLRGDANGRAISFSTGLIEHFERNVESLFCLFARGTMMVPTIPRDAELICSTECQPIRDGCVYLIKLGSHEVIRRILIKPHGVIQARCDNPQVQQEKLDEISSDDIIAEVLWVSHRPEG